MQAHEILKPRTRWRIRRYPDQAAYERGELTPVLDPITGELLPAESEIEGNLLLNEGIAELHNLIAATGGTKWDNTNARLGVGDSAAAEGAGQTGLQGTSKTYAGMEATYPQYAAQVTTWRAVFGGGVGNHAWNEFTVVNAADDTGKNLNRKVSAQGTKTAGQTWTLDLTITWS